MLSDNTMMSQVEAVEQMLLIESSELINVTLSELNINDTLTKEELQSAGEMFLYLNTCPNSQWFKSWSTFYKDLLLLLC